MAISKLTPELIENVEILARRGLNDSELIEALGISNFTFYRYIKEEPKFSNALKKGRHKSLSNVENALFKAAIGFEYEEEVVNKQGDVVSLKKYAQPSITAQIFILKNRLPKYWKDKVINEQDDDTIEKVEKVLVTIKEVANNAE